ncbi:MAG: metallophosphoesterase [Deltaproteobacteria bacterium]|nr:metallophosphoesterase [Deltaproteobacteria bacterium]
MKKPVFLAVAAILCVVGAPAFSAPVVVKGPYTQDVRESSVTVMWETSASASVTLRYGYTPAASDGQTTSTGTLHEVKLSALQKGKTLYYVLEGVDPRQNQYAEGGMSSLSGMVGLPPPPAKWAFVMMGDTRGGHAEHHAITKLIEAETPRFVVNSGDLVADGTIADQWTTYFDVEHDMLLSTVLCPALGNHDAESGKADNYFKFLSPPAESPGEEAYYTVRHGNVWLMVLDSEINVTFLGFNIEQSNWLKAELAKAAADATIDHRFVAIHQGPYASKPGRTGNAAMQGLMDTFKTNKVNTVFSGHDHNYERGLGNNGLTYVITGGGGAGLYEVGDVGKVLWPAHEVLYNKMDYNYVLVTIHGPYAKFEAKDKSGTLIDTWEYGTEPLAECSVDADCNGINKPHDACTGHWECQSQVCEWICDAAADGGVADAGALDTGGQTNDGGGSTDAAADGSQSVDAGAADAGQPGDSGPEPDSGSIDDAGADDTGPVEDDGGGPEDDTGTTPDQGTLADTGGAAYDAGTTPGWLDESGGGAESSEAPADSEGGCSCSKLGG